MYLTKLQPLTSWRTGFVYLPIVGVSNLPRKKLGIRTLTPTDEASKLSVKIMEMYYANETTPIKYAISFLKNEIKSFVG